MIATTRERFGRLDILVNNAGLVEAGAAGRVAFPEIEPERWMRMLDVNLRGVLLGTQHAIDAMRESGSGVIINVSSMAGMGLGRTRHRSTRPAKPPWSGSAPRWRRSAGG